MVEQMTDVRLMKHYMLERKTAAEIAAQYGTTRKIVYDRLSKARAVFLAVNKDRLEELIIKANS